MGKIKDSSPFKEGDKQDPSRLVRKGEKSSPPP
jgi:hypothetical protein